MSNEDFADKKVSAIDISYEHEKKRILEKQHGFFVDDISSDINYENLLIILDSGYAKRREVEILGEKYILVSFGSINLFTRLWNSIKRFFSSSSSSHTDDVSARNEFLEKYTIINNKSNFIIN